MARDTVQSLSKRLEKVEKTSLESRDKLSKCRGQQQEKDHDDIIKIQENTKTIENEIVNIKEDIDTIDGNQNSLSNSLIELAGSMNLITDKVTVLATIETRRNKFIYTIASGVIITLLGALLIYMFKSSIAQAITDNDVENKQIEIVLQKLNNLEKKKTP